MISSEDIYHFSILALVPKLSKMEEYLDRFDEHLKKFPKVGEGACPQEIASISRAIR